MQKLTVLLAVGALTVSASADVGDSLFLPAGDITASIADNASLLLGEGNYTITGSPYSFASSNVTLIGQGMDKTKISAEVRMRSTARGCRFEGIGFEGPDNRNGFFMGTTATDVMDLTVDMCSFSNGTNSDHNAEFTGENITVRNSLFTPTSGHAFVFKGVVNGLIESCTTVGAGEYNGLYIKCGTGKGGVTNVYVNNLLTIGPYVTGINIESVDGDAIDGVYIDGFECRGAYTVGIVVQGKISSDMCTNIVVRNGKIEKSQYGIKVGQYQALVNGCQVYTSFSDIDLGTTESAVLLIGATGRCDTKGLRGSVTGIPYYRHTSCDIEHVAEDNIFLVDLMCATAIELWYNASLGVSYQVQATTNLVSGTWFDVGDPVNGDGATHYMLESTRADNNKAYRVIILP